MPFGGGRKGAAVWADIEEIESDKLKVMCRYCTALINEKIGRVRAHLRKCDNLAIQGKCWRMKKILVIQVLLVLPPETVATSSSSSSTPILGSNLSAVMEMERSYSRDISNHFTYGHYI